MGDEMVDAILAHEKEQALRNKSNDALFFVDDKSSRKGVSAKKSQAKKQPQQRADKGARQQRQRAQKQKVSAAAAASAKRNGTGTAKRKAATATATKAKGELARVRSGSWVEDDELFDLWGGGANGNARKKRKVGPKKAGGKGSGSNGKQRPPAQGRERLPSGDSEDKMKGCVAGLGV